MRDNWFELFTHGNDSISGWRIGQLGCDIACAQRERQDRQRENALGVNIEFVVMRWFSVKTMMI